MQNQKVTFYNAEGHALSGLLALPESAPRAWALFAHCFTCSKNLKAATNIARALTDSGIAVLRFDFTGLGQSEGDFAETNFSSNVSDLLAAVRFLEENYRAPEILLGHSLGGTAILQAAGDVPSAVAVATIGSPSDPGHVRRLLAGAEGALRERGVAEVSLGGRPFTMKRQFLDDLERHELPVAVKSLRKALLVMHAPLDDIVGIDNAAALFGNALHPKSFVSLDNADHLLTREADSLYAGRVLAAWAERYLESVGPAADSPPPDTGSFDTAARTRIGGFRTDIVAGGHALVADEPVSAGGTAAGPSPYDLLSAALASCTSMTLKMYAAHKNIDLESATVRVRHGKIHAKDCEDCESAEGRIDRFERQIVLAGDLTGEQRARLLEIADRCPVHRTLHGEVNVRSTLADA
ncbi:MAG TPA: alpha/beta fold hydrolase [Woeseiaceae bacterium]|nr:alpha/beta fold hydrolase [Woeseiaceae bacterium]